MRIPLGLFVLAASLLIYVPYRISRGQIADARLEAIGQTEDATGAPKRYEYRVPCFADGDTPRRIRVYANEGETVRVCWQSWGVIGGKLYWLNPASGDVPGATVLSSEEAGGMRRDIDDVLAKAGVEPPKGAHGN